MSRLALLENYLALCGAPAAAVTLLHARVIIPRGTHVVTQS
jgi:hypothetical protein